MVTRDGHPSIILKLNMATQQEQKSSKSGHKRQESTYSYSQEALRNANLTAIIYVEDMVQTPVGPMLLLQSL